MTRRHLRWKTGTAVLGGLVVLFVSHHALKPAPLVRVAWLTHAVAANQPIPSGDIRWVAAQNPPASLLVRAQAPLLRAMVTQAALPADSSIPLSDLLPPGSPNRPGSGEVPWAVTVSGPLADYLSIGGRVSIWAPSSTLGSLHQIATGVRVIGLGTGSPPSSAVLAVPQTALTCSAFKT